MLSEDTILSENKGLMSGPCKRKLVSDLNAAHILRTIPLILTYVGLSKF